ncbi:MAG: hypothetical protein WD000_05365 [Thermodesulfobacteriota bacterium]
MTKEEKKEEEIFTEPSETTLSASTKESKSASKTKKDDTPQTQSAGG